MSAVCIYTISCHSSIKSEGDTSVLPLPFILQLEPKPGPNSKLEPHPDDSLLLNNSELPFGVALGLLKAL